MFVCEWEIVAGLTRYTCASEGRPDSEMDARLYIRTFRSFELNFVLSISIIITIEL